MNMNIGPEMDNNNNNILSSSSITLELNDINC